ncbi:MAG: hypothetical protein B7Y51_11785 [Burkholderiales bacterium 28-67-8]|nr:MAG: hypothetical protein B7Y51_11785 [Burkholderiales bacterium 28-67-8]
MDSLTASLPVWGWVILVALPLCLLGVGPRLLKRIRAGRADRNPSNEFLMRTPAASERPLSTPVEMVSCDEVEREYARRLSSWRESRDEVARQRGLLEKLDYQALDAETLLGHAGSDELSNLAAILGLGSDASAAAMVDSLRRAGSHGVASFVRGGHVSYEEVITDVALKLGAKRPIEGTSAAELEKLAVGAALEKMLAQASPAEREAILSELSRQQGNSSAGLVTTAGVLVAAHLSGFGLYMAASSSLAAITGAVGLTLPFAAYTGMSSVLAAVTGPAGWAALLFMVVFKVGGTEYKKTIPGVLAIASCRARLTADRGLKLAKLAREQAGIDSAWRRLSVLERFIKDECSPGTDRQVPKASVPW